METLNSDLSEPGCLARQEANESSRSKSDPLFPAGTLPSGSVAASLQDLMNTLTAYAEPVGYPLKSPTFLPQPGDGSMLSRVDLRVRMGMFEQELTPLEAEIFCLTSSRNDAGHLALLGSVDGFSQLVKRAVRAIEPSDLL